MAYRITDICIACGACAADCPVGAITEGDGKYEINPEVCVECGACAATCPVGAPTNEKPLRSAEAVFLFALFIKINKNRLAAALVQQEGNRQ